MREEKLALLDSFDAEKRRQVVRALGPQALADVPELRRESFATTQPQQLVHGELIENLAYTILNVLDDDWSLRAAIESARTALDQV